MKKVAALLGIAALVVAIPEAHAQKTTDQVIMEAVSPLPQTMRGGATVMAFTATGLEIVRRGTNPMICLADDPQRDGFHAACYHEDLEPFMARGRALRAEGRNGNEARAIRFTEIESGKLEWPDQARSLYSLSSDDEGSFDYTVGTIPGAWGLQAIYVPFATEESIGVSAQPDRNRPWLMHPGTPGAHLMIRIPPTGGSGN
jgi:hypothetical protein